MRNRSPHDMAKIDFSNLLIVTLLCLILLITSSVSDAIAPDGKVSNWQNSNQNISNIKKLLSLHLERSSNASKNISKENNKNISVMAEGGPIQISTSIGRIDLKNISIIDNLEESRERENVPRERNAGSSVVARKGVDEKIKPRKGVHELTVDLEKEKLPYNGTKSFDQNTKPVIEDPPITENNININNQFKTFNTDKSSLTNVTCNANLNHSLTFDGNFTAAGRNMSHIEAKNDTTSKLSLYEKHKPKPTVTSVDGVEVDEPIRSSRTKSSPLGVPRKIDYIVPVVITIIALPLLGAASFVLYRRGRDCWDKRHYRRMDFLIDGMYND